MEKEKLNDRSGSMLYIFYICYLLSIFSAFCTSCSQSKTTNDNDSVSQEVIIEDNIAYYSIKNNRISVDLDNLQKASLSDYFKNIELIPLETNNDVLIGSIRKCLIHQDNFYIFDGQQNILWIFDETGKYVSKINKRGQGPGEYSLIYDMIINSFTGNVDLLSPFGSIYSYDLSGNHKRTIQVADQTPQSVLRAVHRFEALDENSYALLALYNSTLVNYFDIVDNQITYQAYDLKETSEGYSASTYFYRNQSFFSYSLDNETYTIGKDSIVKAYTWDFGKYNYERNKLTPTLPERIRDSRGYTEKEIRQRFEDIYRRIPYQIYYQSQNNKYVIARIMLGGSEFSLDNPNFVNVIYDKSTQESKNYPQLIVNPFILTNDYLLTYFSHDNLDKYINSEMLDNVNQKKFDDLRNEPEEMNPIIIKYHFK